MPYNYTIASIAPDMRITCTFRLIPSLVSGVTSARLKNRDTEIEQFKNTNYSTIFRAIGGPFKTTLPIARKSRYVKIVGLVNIFNVFIRRIKII